MNNTNLSEFFKKLPLDLREAMSSINTSTAVEQIAGEHRLLIDKMGILAEEIGKVMLGVSPPKDFIRNLSDKLGVDRETARNIADDVNQQIFSKVRESLRKLHGTTDDEAEMPAASGPPAMKEYPVRIRREQSDQVGEGDQSSRYERDSMKTKEEQKPTSPLTPLEIKPATIPLPSTPPSAPPSPKAIEGPAFAHKIEEKVSVEPPELRKIERPTIDPYREPVE